MTTYEMYIFITKDLSKGEGMELTKKLMDHFGFPLYSSPGDPPPDPRERLNYDIRMWGLDHKRRIDAIVALRREFSLGLVEAKVLTDQVLAGQTIDLTELARKHHMMGWRAKGIDLWAANELQKRLEAAGCRISTHGFEP